MFSVLVQSSPAKPYKTPADARQRLAALSDTILHRKSLLLSSLQKTLQRMPRTGNLKEERKSQRRKRKPSRRSM